MKWVLGILVLVISATGALYLYNAPFQPMSLLKKTLSPTKTNFWLENEDILIYLETLTRIKNHNLYLSPSITRREILKDTIQSYLEKTDPYAAYLNAEDFRRWKDSQRANFVGIGMEIVKNLQGQTICIPYANSPAEQAGISAGDRLSSIEEKSIQGKSILTIASMARGKKNTIVNLVVINADGKEKKLSVKRSAVQSESISLKLIENIPVIKITAFTPDTKTKLKTVLNSLNRHKAIVIDLRGNAGGDLFATIDSVMLFLEHHKKIVSIKSRQGIEEFESRNGTVKYTSPLYIWQDEGTASAAEVFIAALTNNNKAISIGKKSFGKGTKQEIYELSNGSALFITTGYLQTPDGISFDGKGLLPDHFLTSAKPTTQVYFQKVKNLLNKKNSTGITSMEAKNN